MAGSGQGCEMLVQFNVILCMYNMCMNDLLFMIIIMIMLRSADLREIMIMLRSWGADLREIILCWGADLREISWKISEKSLHDGHRSQQLNNGASANARPKAHLNLIKFLINALCFLYAYSFPFYKSYKPCVLTLLKHRETLISLTSESSSESLYLILHSYS